MQFKGKHRGNSKIKYEHTLIQGLRKFLENIQHLEEISAINPGKIEKIKSLGRFIFSIQYMTKSGLKCLAKSSNGCVQEVFIVSSEPGKLKTKLIEGI